MNYKDDPCWAEPLRRTAERGGRPEEHLQAMMQEVIDRQVAEGIIKTAGLNEHGKMVYRSRIAHEEGV
jgi:hypothetical protein